MYVSGSMYPPSTYSRGEMEGDYPTVPPRLYPHECYPGNPLPLADGKPRPSFYISDILYPSVIPLPGTLPTTGSVTSSGSRLDETSPSSSLGGSPPALSAESHGRRSPRSPEHRGRVRIVQPLPVRLPSVKSKDLKFGIDNILGSPSKPSERTTAEKETPSRNREIDTECEKRGFVPVPPSLGRTREPMIGSIHGDVPPHCILYPSNHAAYHHHHMGGLPPHSHAGGTRLAPTSTGLPSNLPGRFGPRPNEYPGVSSPGQSPSDRAPLPAHGSGCHQAPLDSHSTKRPRPLSVALCWPTVRFHHGPYSVLGSRGDNSTPQSQPKRKRSWSRAVFSNLQRKGLEKRFEVQKYVTKPDRRQVAAMLGLTDAQVKVWFQNRRMKWRHQEEAKRKKEEEDKKKKESELEKGKQTSDSPKVKSTEASKSDSPDTGSKADGPIESGSLGDIEDGEYSSDEERELKIDTQEEYESDMEDDDKCDQPTSMNTN